MQSTIKKVRAFAFIAAALVILTTVGFAQNSASSSAARPEVGEYAEVYRDEKNLQVTVVRFGKRQNKEALVEITGIDHPWNRRIFRVSIEDWTRPGSSDKKIDYQMQHDGGEYNLIVQRGYITNLFLREDGDTGKPLEFSLYYSKELADQARPEHVLTAYLEQQKNPKTSTEKYAPAKSSTQKAEDANVKKDGKN